MKNNKKIYSIKDLIVWQKAHQLVLKIYQITSFFPKEEIYVLFSQIKRSVISIASDIAEGFLTEIQNHFILALNSCSRFKIDKKKQIFKN